MRNVQRTSYARRIKALSDERARLQRELREALSESERWESAWRRSQAEVARLQSERPNAVTIANQVAERLDGMTCLEPDNVPPELEH